MDGNGRIILRSLSQQFSNRDLYMPWALMSHFRGTTHSYVHYFMNKKYVSLKFVLPPFKWWTSIVSCDWENTHLFAKINEFRIALLNSKYYCAFSQIKGIDVQLCMGPNNLLIYWFFNVLVLEIFIFTNGIIVVKCDLYNQILWTRTPAFSLIGNKWICYWSLQIPFSYLQICEDDTYLTWLF